MRGIRDLPLSTVRSTLGVLGNPLNARGKGVPITPKQFHYAFTNNLTEEESQPFFDRYAAPAASKVLFAGALANVAPSTPFKVDFHAGDKAPLLFIGATDDHVVPGKVVKKIAAKYEKGGREAEYREFPGRTHNIVGQDGLGGGRGLRPRLGGEARAAREGRHTRLRTGRIGPARAG